MRNKKKALFGLMLALFGTAPQAFAEAPKTGILGMGAVSGNAPTGHQAVQGGIAANQMAAHNNALDLLLRQAIEAGNAADAKNALQGGLNLALDHKAACRLQGAGSGVSVDLSNPDQTKALLGSRLVAVPAACEKAHMLSALKAAAGLDRFPIPRAIFAKEAGAAELGAYDEARAKYRAAREILALIDANSPAADKAYYPLYLAMAKGLPADIHLWAMLQYEKALPEIKRARSLREPGRERWAKIGADAYAGNGVAFGSLWDKSAVAEGNIAPGTDPDAMTWLFALDAATAAFGEDLARSDRFRCDRLANAKKNPQFASAAKAIAGPLASGPADFSGRPSGNFARSASEIAALQGRSDEEIEMAYRKESASRLLGYLLSKAKESGVLSAPYASDTLAGIAGVYRQDGKYGGPVRVQTYLHRMAGMVSGGTRSMVPAGLIRASLEAGANPNAMDPDGKTPLDMVLANPQGDEAVRRAFLQKDFDPAQCPGNP